MRSMLINRCSLAPNAEVLDTLVISCRSCRVNHVRWMNPILLR